MAAPLPARKQPDVVEVALVAIVVEVQRMPIAVDIHEELCGKPSIALSIEYSPDCIKFGIKNPTASRTKELLCLRK